MTEKKTRTPSALIVINEMYKTAIDDCRKFHHRVTESGYPSTYPCDNKSPEALALANAKDKVIDKISKEIEQNAIKTFSKYGLISVPICHRSTSESGEDRLKIDLKVKKFPECEKEIKAFDEESKRYKNDLAAIEKWHRDALQALAKKEELPSLPPFE